MSEQATLERPEQDAVARPPTSAERLWDRCFRGLTRIFAWMTLLSVVWLVLQIGYAAFPAMKEYGFSFLTGSSWGGDKFGILPEIFGTLYTAILGVGIGSVFGIAIAIFLTEDFVPHRLELVFKNVIELLAAIPSVVYGLWGIFVLIPALRSIFGSMLSGPSILPASLVLAIMVLPTITAISRDALVSVPNRLREAAYGLGATKWESILSVVLPTASRGVYGSIILAFGRALGETMALAMLAGNANKIGWSVFSPADTLAALLANKFPEAGKVEVGALMYAALVLLAITLLVNVVGTWIITRSSARFAGAK